MFDKFGEFDSSEEINRAALAQREEGDEEALRIIAEENGIDGDDLADFVDRYMDELTTPLTAAIGKLDVECKDLKIAGVLADWVEELKVMCMENEEFARAVRSKGKELAGYIALTAENGYKNRVNVAQKIVNKCPEIKKIVGSHSFAIGIPDTATRKTLMKKYYLGK